VRAAFSWTPASERLAAQAPAYPHAFPRTGVTQIRQRARHGVEVNWRHGDKQLVHRHLYDMAGVYLRYGPITVTALDGTENKGVEFPVPRRTSSPRASRIARKPSRPARPNGWPSWWT
jgi:hypothetical protein